MGPSRINKYGTEVVGFLTDSAVTRGDEVSFGSVLVLFLFLEVGVVLVVAAGVTVVHITDFGGALGALLLAPVNAQKYSQVKVSLETYHGLDVLAMSTRC